jgi:uncharacterized membrane protein
MGNNKNSLAAFAYVLGLITGILVLIIENKDKYVKFHAIQSILFCVAAAIVGWVLGLLFMPVMFLGGFMMNPFWIVTSIISVIYALAVLVIWIMLIVRAYGGQKYKLPFIGDLAEQWAK